MKFLIVQKKINNPKARNYSTLIDKCRERIEGWMSATLSFTGGIVVLYGTLQYWI